MTLTTYPDIEQRTPQWDQLRCGIVTASTIGRLVTTRRPTPTTYPCDDCDAQPGDPCVSKARTTPTPIKTVHPARTAAADADPTRIPTLADDATIHTVAAVLAAERLTGWAEDTPTTADMWRGIDLEPIARDTYNRHHQPTTELGFMIRAEDDWRLGYSPDGLIGDTGLIEIKAPRAKGQIIAVLADEVPAVHMGQIQAGLLVSGRAWCDFIPYVGGLPLWVKRILPDPLWHDAIVAACRQVETVTAQMVTDYHTKTAGLPATERYDPMRVELKLS